MRYMTRANNWFDDMFDEMFRTPAYSTGGYNGSLMKTDVHEKDGRYVLDIEVPGYKKEDVNLTLENGNLTISASYNHSNDEKDAKGKVIRQERYTGNCSRSFYIGDAIKEEDIHASFSDGVLHIDFPTAERKKEESKRYITID